MHKSGIHRFSAMISTQNMVSECCLIWYRSLCTTVGRLLNEKTIDDSSLSVCYKEQSLKPGPVIADLTTIDSPKTRPCCDEDIYRGAWF